MDYPVPSLVILVSTIFVLSCRQTLRITDAAKHFTPVTVVGVSNNNNDSSNINARALSRGIYTFIDIDMSSANASFVRTGSTSGYWLQSVKYRCCACWWYWCGCGDQSMKTKRLFICFYFTYSCLANHFCLDGFVVATSGNQSCLCNLLWCKYSWPLLITVPSVLRHAWHTHTHTHTVLLDQPFSLLAIPSPKSGKSLSTADARFFYRPAAFLALKH